jgi:hypothetical protein
VNESEFAQVLQHLQERMRRYGFSELNDRILAELRFEPDRSVPGEHGSSSSQVLRYLDLLESELRLRTGATVRRIIGRFGNVAQTQSGGPIEGLSVEMSEGDRRLFEIESVDLGTASDFQSILDDIRHLRRELAESRNLD